MDRQSVLTTRVFSPNAAGQEEDTNLQVQSELEKFNLEYRLDNKFIYRYAE